MKQKFLVLAAIGAGAIVLTLTIMNPNSTHAADELPEKVTIRVATAEGMPGEAETVETVQKSDDEWKQQLGDAAYRVLRREGTEPPFSSEMLGNKKSGVYTCAGCGTALFSSETKFDSGTGWPSFYAPFADENVAEKEDRSHGMVRVEVECPRCGGHLGHVFPDGPAPTGMRYCINALSLDFKEQ